VIIFLYQMRNLLSIKVLRARLRRPPTCRMSMINWKQKYLSSKLLFS